MINTENATIAMIIHEPELAEAFFSNAYEDLFSSEQNKIIFRKIKGLYESGQIWTWPTLADELSSKIPSKYFSHLLKQLDGFYNIKTHLPEFLKRMKMAQVKWDLLKEIAEQAKTMEPDLDVLEQILRRGKMVEIEEENPSVDEAFRLYMEWLQKQKTNISLGYPTLDGLTDTFNFGELVTIMARTTVGKTFLSLNVLHGLVPHAKELKIGFFSLEMSKPAIAERLLQLLFRKSRWDLKLNIFSDEGYQKLFGEYYKSVLLFDKIYSVMAMEELIKKNNLKIVFIDFLGLVKSFKEDESSYEKTTQKITDIKRMAKDRQVLVILVVQLSRQAGDGSTPVTIDMARESGAIEELSDFIFGIWSPSIDPKNRKRWDNRICLALLKNKRGPTRMIECHFTKETGEIKEVENEIDNSNA